MSTPESKKRKVMSPVNTLGMQSTKSNDKTALITGITGQDGSYLAEFLIDKVRLSWHFIIPRLASTHAHAHAQSRSLLFSFPIPPVAV